MLRTICFAQLLPILIFFTATNSGCVVTGVRILTMPFDSKVEGETRVRRTFPHTEDLMSTDNTTSVDFVALKGRWGYVDVKLTPITGHFIKTRERVEKIHETQITIHNPVFDILCYPAAAVDLPYALPIFIADTFILSVPFQSRKSSPSGGFMGGIRVPLPDPGPVFTGYFFLFGWAMDPIRGESFWQERKRDEHVTEKWQWFSYGGHYPSPPAKEATVLVQIGGRVYKYRSNEEGRVRMKIPVPGSTPQGQGKIRGNIFVWHESMIGGRKFSLIYWWNEKKGVHVEIQRALPAKLPPIVWEKSR